MWNSACVFVSYESFSIHCERYDHRENVVDSGPFWCLEQVSSRVFVIRPHARLSSSGVVILIIENRYSLKKEDDAYPLLNNSTAIVSR
jgi:hypothetical protein